MVCYCTSINKEYTAASCYLGGIKMCKKFLYTFKACNVNCEILNSCVKLCYYVLYITYITYYVYILCTLLKLLCCFNTQMRHIWYPLSVFLFFCDMVPNMTNLVLKQHSSFNSVVCETILLSCVKLFCKYVINFCVKLRVFYQFYFSSSLRPYSYVCPTYVVV